jgi:hypothetical protein
VHIDASKISLGVMLGQKPCNTIDRLTYYAIGIMNNA